MFHIVPSSFRLMFVIPFATFIRLLGFPGNSDDKESVCNAGGPGLIPSLGRFPGEGNGYPLQYSCLENSMDEEPGRLQSMEPQRVGHNRVTNTFTFTFH